MKKLRRMFLARAAMMLLLAMLTTVGAWAQTDETYVKITPKFIRDAGSAGVGATISMHDLAVNGGLVFDAMLHENEATQILYIGEDNHEITITCELTNAYEKNIEINYKAMITFRNGQMIPCDVDKDDNNVGILKTSFGHPMMYNSTSFMVKEIELYIILNEIPMPNGILRSKDEKIDNTFLYSWKDTFKKVMENKFETKPLDWDWETWWDDFSCDARGYNNEHIGTWYMEENFFKMWSGFFQTWVQVDAIKDLADLKEPIKYAWDTFSSWSQEKLLSSFGFTRSTYDWFARYKSWRWGTRRISPEGRVTCSDTRLTQHMEWNWDAVTARLVKGFKSDFRVYKACKGSTITVKADQGYRVGSIIFRDMSGGGNMPGSIDFLSANNHGKYYKNVGYYGGRQVLVTFSNYNGPSSEVTLTVGEDFLFPEIEVRFLKENYAEFEQETYEVETAQYSLLRLKNYPSDYPLFTGWYNSDFKANITYTADDMSYFDGTYENYVGEEIHGSLGPSGPFVEVSSDGVNYHYLYDREDWGHAQVHPIKEGETNIWASMKPGWGYAAAPNVAKTHLVIRGQDPHFHFADNVAHISVLASELGTGPELIRLTDPVNAKVTFKSSDERVVRVASHGLVDEHIGRITHTLTHGGGYGTVVISASQPAKDKYTAGYASYELTVQKPMDASFVKLCKVPEDLTYGDPFMPVFTLRDGDYYMQENHDFTVAYRNTTTNKITAVAPVNSGTYEILFEGMDIYNGTISGGTFTINPLEMADAGYTIDDIPDVHGRYSPDFVLRRNGKAIDNGYIGTTGVGAVYEKSFSKPQNEWQPGDEITLTITANNVANVGGSLSKTFFYSYEGSGTSSDPYRINNTQIFNRLAQEVNSGKDMKGLYFKLTGAIDNPAATIGTIEHPFAGTFDGDKKVILNAKNAIFGRVTTDATVMNLRVIGTTSETGAIALWNEGHLKYNYFYSTNTALNGLAGNSGIGYTSDDGAVRVYKVSNAAPSDMSCDFITAAMEYTGSTVSGVRYYKANTPVTVSLNKKGHEDETPTFYLSIGSLGNAAEGNTGDNTLTVTTNDVDINVAFTPFIKNEWITLAGPDSYEYDGTAKLPAVTVNNGETNLTAGTDYTVTYEDNTNAGTAKVVVKGMGSYTGEVVKTFTITPRTDYTIVMDEWQEVKVMPEPVITCEAINQTLVKDVDYVLAKCTGNNTPTLATDDPCELTIQFVGNYSGQVTKNFIVHFWKGDGSAENPFQISNARQLYRLSEESNWVAGARYEYMLAHYKLMNDIDMDGVSFRPISDRSDNDNAIRFQGTFDGDGHTIKNLTISEGSYETGLFGSIKQSTIANVKLQNVTTNVTTADRPAALLMGQALAPVTISNCVVQGTVPAESRLQYALVGYGYGNVTLSNNYYHVDGKDDIVGTSFGDILTNDGAVGLLNFTVGDGVVVVGGNVTYSNTYDLFGTVYHKNGSTATMNLTSTEIANPIYYAENGELEKNNDGSYTLTFNGPAKIIATKGLDLADAEITLSETEYTFDPTNTQGFEPTVTVTYDGKTLTKDTDYEVTYTDNVNAGSATVTVSAKANTQYIGSQKTFFSIAPLDFATLNVNELTVGLLDGDDITVDIPNIFYQGVETVKPTIGVECGKFVYPNWNYVRLEEGEDKDYTVTYTKADEVGTAYVTVSGKGNYIGSTTKEYTITDQDLTQCTFTCLDIPSEEYGYYADALEKAIKVVSPHGEVLKCNTDFKLSDSQAINLYGDYGEGAWLEAGHQYEVKLEGDGMWCGTKMVSFNIIDSNNLPAQILYDDQTNNEVLSLYYNKTVPSVTLKDRVLYKDGDWNTICLPFSLNKTQLAASPLAGCTLMEMDQTQTTFNQTTGELNLWFDEVDQNPDNDNWGDPVDVVESGKPYLIKWAKPADYVAYDGTNATECSDIVEPVFENVQFSAAVDSYTGRQSDDGNVSFIGTFNPAHLYDNQHTRYYLGANNMLFYPKNSFVQFNAFRAYFEMDLGDAADARELVFNIHFGDDATGVTATNCSNDENMVWYSLDGRKLDKKPTKKGLFIQGGRKVVIK